MKPKEFSETLNSTFKSANNKTQFLNVLVNNLDGALSLLLCQKLVTNKLKFDEIEHIEDLLSKTKNDIKEREKKEIQEQIELLKNKLAQM